MGRNYYLQVFFEQSKYITKEEKDKQDLIVNQSTLKKYLKSKINFIEGQINIYFHDNRILNEGFYFIGLSPMLLDSVFKMGKNY